MSTTFIILILITTATIIIIIIILTTTTIIIFTFIIIIIIIIAFISCSCFRFINILKLFIFQNPKIWLANQQHFFIWLIHRRILIEVLCSAETSDPSNLRLSIFFSVFYMMFLPSQFWLPVVDDPFF